MADHAFLVFVTGETTRAEQAVATFRRLCDRSLRGDYELTVVDVLVDTQLAEDYNVIATPTIVRTRPIPVRRTVGDLTDPARVMAVLGFGVRRLEPEGSA